MKYKKIKESDLEKVLSEELSKEKEDTRMTVYFPKSMFEKLYKDRGVKAILATMEEFNVLTNAEGRDYLISIGVNLEDYDKG